MAANHTPATASIQRRLERWELDHLRALCAVQAEEIDRLRTELNRADADADMWHRAHEQLVDHVDTQRAIGLSMAGEVAVVEGGAA